MMKQVSVQLAEFIYEWIKILLSHFETVKLFFLDNKDCSFKFIIIGKYKCDRFFKGGHTKKICHEALFYRREFNFIRK